MAEFRKARMQAAQRSHQAVHEELAVKQHTEEAHPAPPLLLTGALVNNIQSVTATTRAANDEEFDLVDLEKQADEAIDAAMFRPADWTSNVGATEDVGQAGEPSYGEIFTELDDLFVEVTDDSETSEQQSVCSDVDAMLSRIDAGTWDGARALSSL